MKWKTTTTATAAAYRYKIRQEAWKRKEGGEEK